MTLEREVESDRLVLDRAERGGAEGWAYRAPKRPFGRLAGTSLKITVDGAVLTRWPCDVPRADVDEAMGDAERAKGFRVPLDPLMVLMTLTTSARRPRVRLAFGSRLHRAGGGRSDERDDRLPRADRGCVACR